MIMKKLISLLYLLSISSGAFASNSHDLPQIQIINHTGVPKLYFNYHASYIINKKIQHDSVDGHSYTIKNNKFHAYGIKNMYGMVFNLVSLNNIADLTCHQKINTGPSCDELGLQKGLKKIYKRAYLKNNDKLIISVTKSKNKPYITLCQYKKSQKKPG